MSVIYYYATMRLAFTRYLKLLLLSLLIVVFAVALFIIHQKIIDFDFENASTNQPLSEVADTFSNLAYCSTTNKYQTLDLLTPKKQLYEKNPLIIYVHGGGWSEGDKDNSITNEYASQLASLGIAAASIDYRLSSEAIYPAQNEDVACAITFLINRAANYQIDAEKLILMGDSAGGQLVAMEAISSHHEYLGVIMAYGVSDLNKQITQEHDKNAVEYLGTKATELAKSDSPAFAKTYPNTSFLLIHGTSDTVVPAEESKDFAKILANNGVDVKYVPINHANHAFLGTKNASDEIARKAMLDFIAQLLQ